MRRQRYDFCIYMTSFNVHFIFLSFFPSYFFDLNTDQFAQLAEYQLVE